MALLRENSLTKLATVASIDATSTGLTNIYTVPGSKSLVFCFLVIRITDYTAGGKSTDAIINIGSDDPNYFNIDGSLTVPVTLVDTYHIYSTPLSGGIATEWYLIPGTQAAETIVKIDITTASNATTETWSVDLMGYLV